jgi:ATP-dependent DNA helicase PIF1
MKLLYDWKINVYPLAERLFVN